MDIFFGVFNTEDDFILLNHLILTAKFYIYKCKLNIVNPSLRVYKAKIRDVYQVEKTIATKQNKLTRHFQNGRSFCHMLAYRLCYPSVSYKFPFSFFSFRG